MKWLVFGLIAWLLFKDKIAAIAPELSSSSEKAAEPEPEPERQLQPAVEPIPWTLEPPQMFGPPLDWRKGVDASIATGDQTAILPSGDKEIVAAGTEYRGKSDYPPGTRVDIPEMGPVAAGYFVAPDGAWQMNSYAYELMGGVDVMMVQGAPIPGVEPPPGQFFL